MSAPIEFSQREMHICDVCAASSAFNAHAWYGARSTCCLLARSYARELIQVFYMKAMGGLIVVGLTHFVPSAALRLGPLGARFTTMHGW